uniref:Uncharacterized protein n=1 Tax=Anopheles merus TaxID=30066 RepID=A0A182VHC3_ANOME
MRVRVTHSSITVSSTQPESLIVCMTHGFQRCQTVAFSDVDVCRLAYGICSLVLFSSSVRRLCSSVGTLPSALVRPQPVNRTVTFAGTTCSEYSMLCTISENCTSSFRRIKPISLRNSGLA